jgi:putative ABC transport system permease protein
VTDAPPRRRSSLALALAVRLLPADVRAEVEAELALRHAEIRSRRGPSAAAFWSARQPLAALAARLRWAGAGPRARGGTMFSGLGDDVALAVRGLRRRRGVAAAVIATIAISVGAIGAIASVIDAVLLRPLPYPDADRIVWLNTYERTAAGDGRLRSASNPHDVVDWQRRSRAFEAISAIEGFDSTILAAGEPVRISVARLNATIGRVLGIQAQYGRLFSEDDYGAGVHVVVLGHPLWRSHFSGDPAIVGESVTLAGTSYRVVGVLPPTTVPFPDDEADVWIPLTPPSPADAAQRGGTWQGVIGRIAASSTIEMAREDMDRLSDALAREFPKTHAGRRVAVVPFRDGVVESTGSVLWMLTAAIVVVLAIACANVGHLLLVTVQARRREFAMRAALGARAGRIARLVLVESAVPALVGGAIGLVLSHWLLRGFLAVYPTQLPTVGAVVISPLAIAAAGLATLVAVIVSAVPPLAGARTARLTHAIRSGERGAESPGQRRARAVLVLTQVAMSTALLVGGGLLLRTFLDVRSKPLGFSAAQVLTFNVALSDVHYASRASETAFHRDLAERIRALPGVAAVGASSLLPLTGGDYIDGFSRVGHSEDAFPNVPRSRLQNVTPGYLEALGFRLVAGRFIAQTDVDGAAPIAVVNEALQRQYFPEGAIGQQIRFHGVIREIVGIVGDKRHRGLREQPRADLYIPRAQADWPRWFSWVAVRHTGAVDPLVPAIRAAVRAVDPRVGVDGVSPMSDRVDQTLAPDRFRAVLVGALAAVALLLAVVGLYGLVAYAVARDARDTAIRVALGATSGRTIAAVMRRVVALTAAGILAGIALALASQELLASFVVGVTVRDPLTIGVVAGGLLCVAVAAAAGPAVRAARVDPVLLLRSQ